MATIYLAGGVFNAGERLHNLYLEKYLKVYGHEVILPQREALKFFDGQHFNVPAIGEDCRQQSSDPEIIYVGSCDGPDGDSGGAIEYGLAIASTGRAIVYRTDFRTVEDQEIGVNGMYKLKGTTFIYRPCFFTSLDQVDEYYRELAALINKAVCSLS